MSKTQRRLLWFGALVPVTITLLLVVWIGTALAIYPNEYVRRVLIWRDSDVQDYLQHFPHSELTASQEPYRFETNLQTGRVVQVFETAFETDDLAQFLTNTETQSFIVIQDGQVIYEEYFNDWQRDSMVTSFSVAKSFVSTLVGIAIEEGYIGSIDDPVTEYLPELAGRDARFNDITIRHLLMMSSGLDYQEMRWFMFNGDDPLTTYHPDQREISLENTHIVDPPGMYFLYNKYHPQMLGMILERTTGMSVTEWTQTRLWDPLGMESDGSWSLDSTESRFEKMEAGLNARPMDYAKLGQLFLQDGQWNGVQIVSEEWVDLATGLDPSGRAPAFDDQRFYALMWWGVDKANGEQDFYAAGDHGQYVYVSPADDLVIVRTGDEFGISSDQWTDAFSMASTDL